MQTEIIANGGVTLVISPQNEMEEALLKELMKQDNEIVELRSGVSVLERTIKAGIVIRRTAPIARSDNED